MQKHTPTPWRITEGKVISGTRPDNSGLPLMVGSLVVPIHYASELGYQADVDVMHANAALIIRAVNNHEQLLDALALALPYIEEAAENDLGYEPGAIKRLVRTIRNVIRAAETPAVNTFVPLCRESNEEKFESLLRQMESNSKKEKI
jgi:hypothetical protein